ncbi:MAG: hypothetical protein IT427_20845 [Pirellulales bacterium]|nr:hypothetical protein [Pirellulales bacterium]
MKDPYLDSLLELLKDPELAGGPRLISVHELRAAGALDVPPAWRKSLGGEPVERDLFSDLEDDDIVTDQQSPASRESDEDAEDDQSENEPD